MVYNQTIGKLTEKNSFEEIEINWEILDLLSSPDKSHHYSPDFKFLNLSWFLYVTVNTDYIDLCLQMENINVSPFDVLCIFSIKNVDGSVTNITSLKHTFTYYYGNIVDIPKFCCRNALTQNNSELVPSRNLVIMCKLKHVGNPRKRKLAEMITLSENLKSVFSKEEFCDITLHLKDKEFKAHKVILAARSPVFAAMFKNGVSENQTVMTITGCDSGPFQMFLEYLYSGKLEDLSFDSAFHLYKVAHKYIVPELKLFCVDNMGETIEVENVCDVIVLADECDDEKLFALGQKYFNRNMKAIFASNEWKEFFQNNFTLANKLLLEMAMEVKKKY